MDSTGPLWHTVGMDEHVIGQLKGRQHDDSNERKVTLLMVQRRRNSSSSEFKAYTISSSEVTRSRVVSFRHLRAETLQKMVF